MTPDLDRSVLNVAQFRVDRKLPLLADILDRLYCSSDAEYFVYTNSDIAVQPSFYLAIGDFIEAGHDSFVINRRTIIGDYRSADDLESMYNDPGRPHRGWDCFIFRRSMYPNFRLFDICIGASRAGLALLANLVAYSEHFDEFKDERLTFHIGDARSWLRSEYADYDEHNTKQLMRILTELERERGPFPPESIPGTFLRRKRTLGPIYEFWSRNVNLPIGWSRYLNRLAGRR